MRIEPAILSSLIHDEEYARKVTPHIVPDYFQDRMEKVIAQEILAFFIKYNKPASQEIIKIELNNRADLSDKDLQHCVDVVTSLLPGEYNQDWLIQRTEKFCRDRAVYNAIMESIRVFDGSNGDLTQDAIPKLLQDALAVNFDQHIGHDYINNADDRFEFYHRHEEKIPFNLDMLDKITAGGLSKKSLFIILSGTNVGKSMFLCHVAASTLMQGKNVLYITLEMSEERIAERIDANLMNISMDELKVVDKSFFDRKLNQIRSKTNGKLIIKEYPTASAHVNHFRALLEDLKIKRDFMPELLIIDYLNICTSARIKANANANSYTLVKSIVEEIRGLAIEYNIPALSATQSIRSANTASDMEITDISESFGSAMTADVLLGMIRTEELDQLNQVMFKQLKNRYGDPSINRRFVLGVDRARMKFYDLEAEAQKNIADSGQSDTPSFDKTSFGKNTRGRSGNFSSFNY